MNYDDPTCPTCKTRERSYDNEPGPDGEGSYYSYCDRCFWLHANAPYCHNTTCSQRVCGTRSVLINGYDAANNGAVALYQCPRCHNTATAVDWARQCGEHAANADMAREDWSLIRTRLRHVRVDDEHPVARAYARAYAVTARIPEGQ